MANVLSNFVGVRELLLGGAAIGLVLGVCWADDRYVCERIEQDLDALVERDASLETFVAERCQELAGEADGCDHIEVVSRDRCRSKLRVQARRVDTYGEELGTFITLEGLSYSPLLKRWRVRETIDETQILGLPVP